MATAAKFPVIESQPTGEDLARKTVVLKTRFGLLGNSRKVSSDQIEVDADKKLIKVSKVLLESKELAAIRSLDNEFRDFLTTKCLTYGETSLVLVPLKMVPLVEERIEKFEKERERLVEIFLKAYPDLCELAAKRLRGVYNPADYPSIKIVRSKFTFRHDYLPQGVPASLKEVGVALFRKRQAKYEENMREGVEELKAIMRETLLQMVKHLSERLTEEDGKAKTFKASAIDKMKEFLTDFDIRNVADDEELKSQVDKARKLLDGVSVEELRVTETIRDRVKGGMDQIATQLDGLLINRPGRKFRGLLGD